MKKFHFSLQAVQTVRERESNDALEKYARTLKLQTEAEAALAASEGSLRDHLAAWRGRLRGAFSPMDMLQHEHAREMMERRRRERSVGAQEAAANAQLALAGLQMARQKSEVVEKFHDRQRKTFNLALLKEEQHFMDELAAGRPEHAFFERGVVHA